MKDRISTTGCEDDAFGRWRHYLCYIQRAGVRRKFKQQYNRRRRRVRRLELRAAWDS